MMLEKIKKFGYIIRNLYDYSANKGSILADLKHCIKSSKPLNIITTAHNADIYNENLRITLNIPYFITLLIDYLHINVKNLITFADQLKHK